MNLPITTELATSARATRGAFALVSSLVGILVLVIVLLTPEGMR